MIVVSDSADRVVRRRGRQISHRLVVNNRGNVGLRRFHQRQLRSDRHQLRLPRELQVEVEITLLAHLQLHSFCFQSRERAFFDRYVVDSRRQIVESKQPVRRRFGCSDDSRFRICCRDRGVRDGSPSWIEGPTGDSCERLPVRAIGRQ